MLTTRLFQVSLGILLLATSIAGAETKLLLVRAGSRPDGTTIVPATKFSGTTPVYWNPPNGQLVIPRFANGITHPAGQVIGWGRMSAIQATSATEVANPAAVVVSEDFLNANKSMAQSHSSGDDPVLYAAIRDFTLLGRDYGNDDYFGDGEVRDDGAGRLTLAAGAPTSYAISGTSNPGWFDVTNATNATPITITTATAHGLNNNDLVTIRFVNGNTAANGVWKVANATGTTFDLVDLHGNNSVGNGGFTSSPDAMAQPAVTITTTTAHSLANNDVVYIQRVLGNVSVNGIWAVGNVTSTTCQLAGSWPAGNYFSGSGTLTKQGLTKAGSVASVGTAANGRTLVTTVAAHGLSENALVKIDGVSVYGGPYHVIQNLTSNTFELADTFTSTAATGGVWACWASEADRYAGAMLDAAPAIVEGVTAFGIPGTGVLVTRSGSYANKTGQHRPFENAASRIDDVHISRCFRGLWVKNIDAVVGRVTGAYSRDFLLRLSAGVKLDGGVHTWGSLCNCMFVGSGVWGGPIYTESGGIGLYEFIGGKDLGPIYNFKNAIAALYVNGTNSRYQLISTQATGTNPPLQPVAVICADQQNTFEMPQTVITDGGIGILMLSGTRQRVRGNFATQGDNSIGIALRSAWRDVKNLLNGSALELSFISGSKGVGLDLVDSDGVSQFGVNNFIRIQRVHSADFRTLNLPAIAPSSWNSTNVITVNGRRVRGTISAATAASPIVCTSNGHGLSNGDTIVVNDGVGLTGLNTGDTLVTVQNVTTNTFEITSSTGSGTYTANTAWWGQPE